jgi:phosphate transport system substrate-binding protein
MKKLLTFMFVAIVLAGCQPKADKNKDAKVSSLTGAGATFPMPFYNLAFKNYAEKNGVLVTYGGIGSGGGIRSLKDKVVDFGATDAYLEDNQLKEFPMSVVHIPTCIGAVVIAYNLPGITELKLSNALLEGIFLGEIKKWNDAKIVAENPSIKLPATAITFVHRTDGSGTTHIFSDYMSKISAKWKNTLGTGKDLKWTIGIGAKGNPGVAGTIKQTVGAIGYIGSEYAFSQDIPFAQIQNQAGNYVKPTIESLSASAKGEIPADTRVMLTNSADPAAYPISAFTWLIIYKEQAYGNRSKAQALEAVKLINWMLSADAQNIAQSVDYAPLPEKAVSLGKEILNSVTYNGKSLLK